MNDANSITEAFLEERGRILRPLVRALVRDPEVAEDLEQKVWLEAFRTGFDKIRSWKPWCRTVAMNIIRSEKRSGKSKDSGPLLDEPDSTISLPDEVVIQLEAQRSLDDALAQLDEPYRSTIVLRYFTGLNSTEIGERKNLAPATVRMQLRRGLEKLRGLMDAKVDGQRNLWAIPMASLVGIPISETTAAATSTAAAKSVTAQATSVVIGSILVKKISILVLAVILVAGFWIGRANDDEVSLPAVNPVQAGLEDRDLEQSRGVGQSQPNLLPEKAEVGAAITPAAVENAQELGSIKGLITTEDDRPIAGAFLCLSGAASDIYRVTNLTPIESGNSSADESHGKSSEDGSFALAPPAGSDELELLVYAPGYRSKKVRDLGFGSGMRSQVNHVRLEKMDSLVCILMDAKNQPVGNVDLEVDVDTRPNYSRTNHFVRYQTKTASDGTFIMGRYPSSMCREYDPVTERVRAAIPGSPVTTWSAIHRLPRDEKNRVILKFPLGQKMKIRCEDTTGRAVPHIPIVANVSAIRWHGKTTTDENGLGEFAIVPHGMAVDFSTSSDEWIVELFPSGRNGPTRIFKLPETENDLIVVKLRKSLSLSGRLIDAESGAGLSGIDINARHLGHESKMMTSLRFHARTDKSGKFTLRGMRQDEISLTLGGNEWRFDKQKDSYFSTGGESTTLMLSDADVENVELAVKKCASISGRVLSAGGQALPGVHVAVERIDIRPDINGGTTPQGVLTDANGAFVLANVPADQKCFLRTRHRDWAPTRFPFQIDSGASLRDVTLVVDSGAQLTLNFVDPRGNPIAGVRALVAAGESSSSLALAAHAKTIRAALSDAEGRVTFEKLSVGAAYISIADEDPLGRRFQNTSKKITLKSGAQSTDIQIDTKQLVRGIIRSTDGRVVPNVTIVLETGAGIESKGRTDANGCFSFEARKAESEDGKESGGILNITHGRADLAGMAKEGEAGWNYTIREVYHLELVSANGRFSANKTKFRLVKSPQMHPRSEAWEIVVTQ